MYRGGDQISRTHKVGGEWLDSQKRRSIERAVARQSGVTLKVTTRGLPENDERTRRFRDVLAKIGNTSVKSGRSSVTFVTVVKDDSADRLFSVFGAAVYSANEFTMVKRVELVLGRNRRGMDTPLPFDPYPPNSPERTNPPGDRRRPELTKRRFSVKKPKTLHIPINQVFFDRLIGN
jgi:hypothetical protein